MSLITSDTVKAKFTRWEVFCEPLEAGQTTDDVLTAMIEDAETELLEYIPGLTDQTITPQLTRHLLNIVRYNCFNNLHGEAAFETKPRTVANYEATIKMLERYRDGEFSVPDDPAVEKGEEYVKFSGRPRRMNNWFLPPYPSTITTED